MGAWPCFALSHSYLKAPACFISVLGCLCMRLVGDWSRIEGVTEGGSTGYWRVLMRPEMGAGPWKREESSTRWCNCQTKVTGIPSPSIRSFFMSGVFQILPTRSTPLSTTVTLLPRYMRLWSSSSTGLLQLLQSSLHSPSLPHPASRTHCFTVR